MPRYHFHKLAPLTLLPFLSSPAAAEVSDKIPSVGQVWFEGLLLGCLFLFLARWRWWLGLLLLPLTITVICGWVDMMNDSYLGPAILAEQGQPYVLSLWFSSIILAGFHVFGLWLGVRRRFRSLPANKSSGAIRGRASN